MIFDVIGLGAINEDRIRIVKYEVDEVEEYTIDKPYYASDYESFLGGSVVNTLVGLARLNFKVGIIGLLGNDNVGKRLLQEINKYGVDFLGKIINNFSGIAEIEVDTEGRRRIIIHPGVNDLLEWKYLEDVTEYVGSSHILHTSTFACSLSYEPIIAQVKLMNIAKTRSLNFGWLYCKIFNKKKEIIEKVLTSTDLLFINKNEINYLMNSLNYRDNAFKMAGNYGIKVVTVTLGSEGAYVLSNGREYLVEAVKVRAIDTTGAGDAFVTGFLAGYLMGRDLRTCCSWGVLNASKCVVSKGAVNYELPDEIIREITTRK